MFSGFPYEIKMCRHLSDAKYKIDLYSLNNNLKKKGQTELFIEIPTDSYCPEPTPDNDF